jgi:NitT/TauT family transport system substrate-binding protein
VTDRTGRRLRAACAGAVIALVAAGCSTGSSTSSTASTTSLPQYGPAEKTTLNVGVVPAIDSAGFFVAMHDGLFAKEGLTINYTPEVSSETAVQQQVQGKLDITGGNYVSYITEVAEDHEPLEVVAEGSIMTPGTQVIYTPANSPVKSVTELEGKTLAVNAPGNIDYLLDVSVLSGYGIKIAPIGHYEANAVNFADTQIPFPVMATTVTAKNSPYAAATMPEPFASLSEQSSGMVPLVDLDQGATQQFPIEGYVVTKQWAQANPNTLKRFLAALEEGQEISDTQREQVELAFESITGPGGSTSLASAGPYGRISPAVASLVALNTYPIGIDPTRIQRVADVMYEFGLLKQPFNVSSMIMPTSAFNFTPFGS